MGLPAINYNRGQAKATYNNPAWVCMIFARIINNDLSKEKSYCSHPVTSDLGLMLSQASELACHSVLGTPKREVTVRDQL